MKSPGPLGSKNAVGSGAKIAGAGVGTPRLTRGADLLLRRQERKEGLAGGKGIGTVGTRAPGKCRQLGMCGILGLIMTGNQAIGKRRRQAKSSKTRIGGTIGNKEKGSRATGERTKKMKGGIGIGHQNNGQTATKHGRIKEKLLGGVGNKSRHRFLDLIVTKRISSN